jgi:hypothetical protein
MSGSPLFPEPGSDWDQAGIGPGSDGRGCDEGCDSTCSWHRFPRGRPNSVPGPTEPTQRIRPGIRTRSLGFRMSGPAAPPPRCAPRPMRGIALAKRRASDPRFALIPRTHAPVIFSVQQQSGIVVAVSDRTHRDVDPALRAVSHKRERGGRCALIGGEGRQPRAAAGPPCLPPLDPYRRWTRSGAGRPVCSRLTGRRAGRSVVP